MKRLIVALVASVAVSAAFAKVTYTNEFESASCTNDFVVTGSDNESEVVDYNGTQPRFAQPYPCDGYGEKYLSLDTGDATLWRAVNATGKTYFDMAMQFNPSATAPELPEDVKIALYLNSASNIVVLAGPVENDKPTAYVTGGEIAPGAWGRVTISADEGSNGLVFKVCLDGTLLTANAGATDSFPSMTASTTIASVGFSGTGALDDFVARTTDPFLQNGVAAIGGEFYASYNDALKEALEGAPIAVSNCTTGVVTDGTAEHPYEIADANALKILAAAVQSNPAARSLSYVQTADITWTSEDGAFAGIGVRSSIAFTGTYDGGDHTISGMTLTPGTYMGIFWFVNGATIKNFTVENLGFYGTPTGEYGCAIVGEGFGTLERLARTQTDGFIITNTHNSAGIMVHTIDGGVTTFVSCTNSANLVSAKDKMGGICCFANNAVVFTNCVNTGDYTLVAPGTGVNGYAGIIGYVQGSNCSVTMQDCKNTGRFINELDGSQSVVHGQFFGSSYYANRTLTDLGGNKFMLSEGSLIGKTLSTKEGTPFTINGFEYATVAGDVGTTVPQADLAANAEYLVLRDIAASATPVFTLTAANDYIAFNTNGYSFAGSVAVSNPNMMDVEETESGAVKTFTAAGGTAVASITKGEPATTTQYNTLAKALAAAESGDTVVLLANNADAFSIPDGVTVDCSTFANTGAIGGVGTIKVNSAPADAPVFANDWTGTYMINWVITGATGATGASPFSFNTYGQSGSTVCLAQGYEGWMDAEQILPYLEIKSGVEMRITNGNSNSTTTFAKLSGAGNVYTSIGLYSQSNRFCLFSDVEGFTGQLYTSHPGNRYTEFKIGNIVSSAGYGTALVKLGDTRIIAALDETTLNGESAALCADTVDAQAGIYKVGAVVTKCGVETGYATVENAFAVSNPELITVLDGSEMVARQGYDIVDNTYVPNVTRATFNGNDYAFLATAIADAAAIGGGEVTLVAQTSESVTIPLGVVVTVVDDVVFSGKISGAGAIKYTKAPASFNVASLATGEDGWKGTFVIAWDDPTERGIQFNTFGIGQSTVEIAGNVVGWAGGSDVVYDRVNPTVKVTGSYKIQNGTSTFRSVFPKVTGTGTLVFNSDKKYAVDSLEDWNGVLTNSYNSCYVTNIVSGTGLVVMDSTNPADGGSYISVGAGFSGTVEFTKERWNKDPQLLSVANGSRCTVALNYNVADYKYRLAANGSATSTIAIGGNVKGYLLDGNGTGTGNIDSAVVINGGLTLNNGYPLNLGEWTAKKCVKFSDLTVNGLLALSYPGDGWYGYGLVSVASLNGDGTGSITVGTNFCLRVDAVDFATAPSGTDALVALAIDGEDIDALHHKGRLYGTNGVENAAIAVTTNGVATGQYLVYDSAKGGLVIETTPEPPSDPWNTPSSDAGVAESLSEDGITTDSGAVSTVAEFTALVDYITNNVAGVSVPADMSAAQKANAVLCYALNATTIPDKEITSADVTIDAVTTGESGSMTLTVAIAGVTVGNVDASLVAKVVSAKGGTALNEMSAANVDVSAYASENGKVVITVTPTKANSGDPDPTTFFMSAVITK